MTQTYIHSDGTREIKDVMALDAIEVLIDEAGITEDVDCDIHRLSKWGVKINLVKGLCLHASFKINARTGKFERLV